MKCWKCGKDASGICRFCGRAVCKEHVTEMPFILTVYCCGKDVAKAIVVADVLYCGCCKPLSSPIEMPELNYGGDNK